MADDRLRAALDKAGAGTAPPIRGRQVAPTSRTTTPSSRLADALTKASTGGSSGLGYRVFSKPRAAAQQEKAPRSLWDQINPISMAGQTVRGVSALTRDVISMPWNAARVVPDLARSLGAPIGGESKLDMSGNAIQDIQAGFREYLPLLADIGGSVAKTANVTGIGSQKNIIGKYQQAVEEGRWVDQLMEDAGNVGLLAAGAGKILGSVAAAGVVPTEASSLLRRAAAGERGLAGTTTIDASVPRSLSSAYVRAETLPPRLPIPTEAPLRLPGRAPSVVKLSRAPVEAMAVPEIFATEGRGLAGLVERTARPGLSSAEIVADRAVSPVATAQSLAKAGDIARQVSTGAQWLDPVNGLVSSAEKVIGRGTRGLASVAERNPESPQRIASGASRAAARIERWRNEADIRVDAQDTRSRIQKAVERPQFYVDESLARLGIDKAERDLYGGVILDATDRSLDTYADLWRNLDNEGRTAALKRWNAGRAKEFELSAERLDRYNEYRDGTIDPDVGRVLAEGLDQVRTNEGIRRTYQKNAGNLAGEQLDEPMVLMDHGDGELVEVPYHAVSPEQLDAAFKQGRVKYPWLESRARPEYEARLAKVAEREADVQAQIDKMQPLKREVDILAQQRTQLPQPGRNVPWADTPAGRAEMVAENQARIAELQNAAGVEPGAWAALAGGERITRAQTVADAAANAVERSILADQAPDPVIGVNPMEPGMWTPGTWNQGIVERQAAIDFNHETMGQLGEPMRPVAERIIQAEAVARYKLDQAATELWRAEEDLRKAKKRADNFYSDLNQSQQEMIGKVSRNGVAKFQDLVKTVNPSGRRIGGWEIDKVTKQPKLGGLVGDIAQRLGIYDTLFDIVDEVRYRDFNRQYETYRKNHQGGPPMSFDDYVDFRLKKDDTPNIAYDLLVERADQLTDPKLKAIWKNSRDELDQAYVEQILTEHLQPFKSDDVAMGGHAAYQSLIARINSLPPELRRHVSNDTLRSIDDAYKSYRDKFHAELKASVDRNLAYVPARFRTPLQEGRRALAGLYAEADAQWIKGTQEGRDVAEVLYAMTENAPTSMAMYVEQNRAVPIHLIAGDGQGFRRRPQSLRAPAEVTVATPMGAQARLRGMRVNTMRQYANLEAREMINIASQQSVMSMATDPTFSRSLAEVPGMTEALATWSADHEGKLMMRQVQEMLRDVDPNQQWAVVKNATEATTPGPSGNMASIEFNKPAQQDLLPRPGERIDQVITMDPITGEPLLVNFDELDQVKQLPEVRVVPAYLSKVLDDYLNPNTNQWLVMYDQMTQLWKTATLAWSVAWVTYNAVGNALMATFSYGQSPTTLVKNIAEIRRELRSMNEAAGFGKAKPFRMAMKYDTLSAAVPTRMGAHGPSWAERLSTMQVTDDATRLGKVLEYTTTADKDAGGSWIGKVTEASYTLNEFTDNMFRTSVLMDDVHKRLLREAPIKPEWLNPDGTLRSDLSVDETRELMAVSDKANAAMDRSVRAALNTMGDFTRLTQFERNVVKRVFPFYPWLRHQTAMAMRMPLQNPMRWAWMHSLADLLADDEMGDEMNALMSGMIPTPFGAISLAAANPFGKGVTGFGSSNEGSAIFDPSSMLAAVNPIPKTIASLVTGIDFNQAASVSRPSDQKYTNDYGQEVGGSALTRLQRDPFGAVGEIGYTALNLTPQTKGLRDTLLGAKPRYDSGDVIDYADNRPGGRLGSLARAARIPFMPTDITQLSEVAKTKDEEARRAARRRRARAGSNG